MLHFAEKLRSVTVGTLNITEVTIFLPLYTLLFALAVFGTFFPDRAAVFRKTYPLLYMFVLGLAAIVQLPILVNGYWEVGIAFSRIGRDTLFDASVVLLPFIYLSLFFFSLYFQQKKQQDTSFTLALFSSIIMCPSLYLTLMSAIYYLLRS